jgi:hypothetical protein
MRRSEHVVHIHVRKLIVHTVQPQETPRTSERTQVLLRQLKPMRPQLPPHQPLQMRRSNQMTLNTQEEEIHTSTQ